MRKSKAEYFKDFIRDNSTSSTKLWKVLNPLINPNKDHKILVSDFAKSNSNFTAQDLAFGFGKFFASILDKIVFVPLGLCIEFTNILFRSIPTLNKFNKSSNKFFFHRTNNEEVCSLLSKLDQNSAPGISGIESVILRSCSVELCAPITYLFNLCIEENSIPDEWKISFLTPIFKGKGSNQHWITIACI